VDEAVIEGPPLPFGWRWVAKISWEPLPHRAECIYAPLVIKSPRGRPFGPMQGWTPWVRDVRLRLKDGEVVTTLGRHGVKGTRCDRDGVPLAYPTPMEAAVAAVAFYTGARVGAAIPVEATRG